MLFKILCMFTMYVCCISLIVFIELNMFKLNYHFVFQSGTEACEKCNMKEVCNLVNDSCNIKGLFICYFTFQSFKDILKMAAISDMKSVSNEQSGA